MILAPLRGVTIRCFRETFAAEIREAGFVEAITPFIAAMPGVDPLKDRELTAERLRPGASTSLRLTPQFIGKDPVALRACLERVKAAGYDTADLNCGCPFPMVRNKFRGSGMLRTPQVLKRMLAVGCEVMGPGRFSVKTRIGVTEKDELLKLMPIINAFPLRFLTVHARTAKQMYEGAVDHDAFARIAEVAKMPVVENGDLDWRAGKGMVGRSFILALGAREDAPELLKRYLAASAAELCGERPVLGRLKELVSYWQPLPQWRRLWPVIKIARSLSELTSVLSS